MSAPTGQAAPAPGGAAAGLLTPEVLAMVGVTGPRLTAPAPVERDALRRFVQASMEQDPIHWDDEVARASRYGEVVAPPLYPVHVFRRPAGTPDPLDRLAEDPDWDGTDTSGLGSLPEIDLPLPRLLNGGVGAEVFRLARLGDVISMQARYLDLEEKATRSGPMVVVRVGTDYTLDTGEPLLRTVQTILRR
ncbi:MAG: MaoC family dehydratase N-terminal domain-containing protein [Acidimicrobiia bacterium]